MFIRLLVLCVALIGLGILSGCAKVTRLNTEDIRAMRDQKISRLVMPARIESVVLTTADSSTVDSLIEVGDSSSVHYSKAQIVDFGVDGGQYDSDRAVFYGTTDDGTAASVPLDSVKFVEIKRTDLGRTFVAPADYLVAMRRSIMADKPRLKRGESTYWDIIEFNGDGGYYDTSRRAVIGETKKGSNVSVDLSLVALGELSRTDYYKSARFGLVIIGVVVFALGIAAYK